MRQSCLLVFAIALCLCNFGGRAASQPADAAAVYAEGVADFQSGDYAQALAAFLKARDEGYTGPQLGYSLGSTYYQLGRYDSARHEFESLLSDPALAGLCHYNLGLIAQRQGDVETAREEFKAAETQSSEPAVKRLAADTLAKLPPPVTLSWFGFLDG